MHHGPSVCNTLCSRVKIKMVNGAARAPATPKGGKEKEWEGERMLLPVVKLGSLALRTLSKPIASRLKQQAGNYPKFREYIIGLAQVLPPPLSLVLSFLFVDQRSVLFSSFLLFGEMKICIYFSPRLCSSAKLGIFFVVDEFILLMVLEPGKSSLHDNHSKAPLRLISCNSICFHLLAYGVSCPWQAMKQKEQELAKELELLRVKLHELEHLARGRGLLSIFGVTQGQESLKSVIPTLAS
ncbi:hypothetical protein BHM03_00049508 [Ensete ventricosum]|nr:hypothetical protein BHM03_00049508 [Ensete ventricosum]